MRTKALPILPIFRSSLQARLLALLFLHSEREWPGAELARRIGAPRQTVNDEMRRLEAAGLVVASETGTAKLYRAATESPLYEPLRELVEKTLGVEVALKRVLGEVPGIEVAVIYGSWAAERLRPASDIDVLVVGDASFDEVADAVREVEELAGREIGINVYTREELDEQLRSGSGFVRNVLSAEMKPLVGDPETLHVA
jgi:predicted nucleotidyltransferase